MQRPDRQLPRRALLRAAVLGAPMALLASRVGRTDAQPTPKRSGTLSLRGWNPPHFDPHLSASFATSVANSFTHSRLLRHRAGPDVAPGTFQLEGDLAESWSRISETVYLFKLRQGVRWHNRPPVNGRELTAEDVKYTFERFLTVTGNVSRFMLDRVERIEVTGRYNLKFVLKAPFAWFLDMLASPMVMAIIAKECVETYGDLKKPEAVVGTGPWMLESYRHDVGTMLTRHPLYFHRDLPYIDRVHLSVNVDNSAAAAAFLAGEYDLGWELPGRIPRSDWISLRERLMKRRPNLKTAEFASNQMDTLMMRCDRPPFGDVRVRRALSLAMDRKALLDIVGEGLGAYNTAVPAGLNEWALPWTQLGAGTSYYSYDPAAARVLLADAGYRGGLHTTLDYCPWYGSDAVQAVVKYMKDIGVDVKLNPKEYGAFLATTVVGKYEGLAYCPVGPAVQPYSYLFTRLYPGEPLNQSHVDDPKLTVMLDRLAAASDRAEQRHLLHDVQRYVAEQVYYIYMPSGVFIAAWDGALKNYGPNMGYDYGGRLVAAWLER